jgi:hypothetical protein
VSGIVDVGGWVAPAMELVYEQGTPAFRGQWPKLEPMLELAEWRPARGDWAHPALGLPAVASRRVRGDAWGDARGGRGAGEPAPDPPVPPGVLHDNSTGRVAALDDAGVELQLISPGPSIDACLQLPSNLAAGVFAAYNRYITAYCRPHPRRLGAVLQLHGSEPRWSAHEIAELRGEPSVRAASLCLPVRISPEDRHFDPLWEALERADLPVLHRPTLCARIWSPGRLLAYLRGAGVLNRHPGLRVAFVAGESSDSAGELVGAVAGAIAGAAANEDSALGSHLFAAVGATELAFGRDAASAMLWTSDFPLRPSLGSELTAARQALGPSDAQEVLVAAPMRFLGSGAA